MQGQAGSHQAGLLLRPQPIESLVARPANAGPVVRHVQSLGPARIAMPPLRTGAAFFDVWPVREYPEQGCGHWPAYHSYAPPLFVLHDVLLHSSAGIIGVGGAAISETLAHTQPKQHHYETLAKDIRLTPGAITKLPGVHVSLLTGAASNYAQALLGGLARITQVPENYLAETTTVLIPAGLAMPADSWGLLDLPPSVLPRMVHDHETLRIETLILPLSVTGDSAPHPCVLEFYRRISANVAPAPGRFPTRIILARGPAAQRLLLNEDDLIATLAPLGFRVVRPETLSLADQVRLFRGAEAIIAPHGAALANLGFARPGTIVVELLMDACVDWRYRHLAALAGLDYDCVLGRALRPWPDLGPALQTARWQISAQHVAASVAQALAQHHQQTRVAA